MSDIDKKIKQKLSQERRQRVENSSFDKCFFTLKNADESSLEMVDKLNRVLGPTGAEFKIVHNETPEGFSSDTLVVSYRPEQVRYRTKRDAGRRKSYVSYEEDGVTYRATVNRVRKLIKDYGSVEAARMIGMNKSGMYKRLKSATNSGISLPPDDKNALGDDDILF